MDDYYRGEIVSLTDESGEEQRLEHIDTVDIEGELYMAFLPADMDEDDEDYGLVILKRVVKGDEDYLSSLEDEDELDAVHEVFIQRLSEEDE